MNFATRLKQLRKEADLTQNALAEEIGVTKGTVSVWERGVRTPEFDTLFEPSKRFNVSMGYILGESNDRELSIPSDVFAQQCADEEEMELFLDMAKLYWQLCPHSRTIIRGCIASAYSADKLAELIEENRFKVTVECLPGCVPDDSEESSQNLGENQDLTS